MPIIFVKNIGITIVMFQILNIQNNNLSFILLMHMWNVKKNKASALDNDAVLFASLSSIIHHMYGDNTPSN